MPGRYVVTVEFELYAADSDVAMAAIESELTRTVRVGQIVNVEGDDEDG
jgi:hypothetical protein